MLTPRTAAAFLICLALPSSAASGTLNVGPLWVEVQNGVSGTCAVPGDPFCVVAAEGNSIGTLEIDAKQDVQYAGIGVETDKVESATGLALLPDQSISVRGSDILIRQPVFPLLVENTGGKIGPPVIGDSYYLTIKPEGVFLNYFGLDARSESGPLSHRQYGVAFEDRFVGYEQLGPADMVDWDDTDYRAYNAATGVCSLDGSGACAAEVISRTNSSQAFTPNVALGVTLVELEVASDADLLGPGTSDYVRGRSSAAPLRMTPGAVAGPLKPMSSNARLTPDGHSLDAEGLTPSRGETAAGEEGVSGVQSAAADSPALVPLTLLLAAGGIAAVLLLSALALYSRLSGRDVLTHPQRAAILHEVGSSPGITPAEISKVLPLSRTALGHHIRMLEKSGFVRIEHHNKRTFLFPIGYRAGVPPAVTVDATKALIFDLIRAHPEGLSRAAIAALTPHMPKRTRNHTLRKLQELRLIEPAKAIPNGLVAASH